MGFSGFHWCRVAWIGGAAHNRAMDPIIALPLAGGALVALVALMAMRGKS